MNSATKGRKESFFGKVLDRFRNEDFVRVYPNGVAYRELPIGVRRHFTEADRRNFLNHEKFYKFCSQFVQDKIVGDIGCGSGYGSKILSTSGAKKVYGFDISKHALRFAKKHYSEFAVFSQKSATNLKDCPDNLFDVIVCSEVLEHVKEQADSVINEMKRVSANDARILIGTPNTEMLRNHGFDFTEIMNLMKRHFREFYVFENALVPFGEARERWKERQASGQIGIVISENINIEETVIPAGMNPELKSGIRPGIMTLESLHVDTTHLHNTHSWLILAVNKKET